jgi:hypothetical protein
MRDLTRPHILHMVSGETIPNEGSDSRVNTGVVPTDDFGIRLFAHNGFGTLCALTEC